MRKLVTSVITLFLLSQPYAAVAQTQAQIQAQQRADETRDAVINSWNNLIHPKFIQAASSSDEENAIRNTQLNIVGNQVINAWANGNTITLPMGMLVTLDTLADAEINANLDPAYAQFFNPYLRYLVRNYEDWMNGNGNAIETFWVFAGISQAQEDAITSDPRYGDEKEGLMVNFLAFICGHEMGHIVLHHPTYDNETPAQARANEYAADKFGYELAERANFHPVLALTILAIFGVMENGALQPGALATHPPAECRMAALLKIDYDKFLASPTAGSSLAQVGLTVDGMKQQMQQLENACATELANDGGN
jgi:hypothetical protein